MSNGSFFRLLLHFNRRQPRVRGNTRGAFGLKSLIVAAAAAATTTTTAALLVTSGSKKVDITTVFSPLFGHAPLNPGECLSCFVSPFVAALPTDEGIIIV